MRNFGNPFGIVISKGSAAETNEDKKIAQTKTK